MDDQLIAKTAKDANMVADVAARFTKKMEHAAVLRERAWWVAELRQRGWPAQTLKDLQKRAKRSEQAYIAGRKDIRGDHS